MEVLRAVLDSGSVTGAARLLNISQPAVTGMLRHTEDQLRLRLFERVKGRLEPTPEARALYAELCKVFERVELVNRMVEDLRDARLGQLSLAAIHALGTGLLPSTIGAFAAAHDGTTLRFDVQTRREVVELAASGIVDLGFGFLLPEHPRVRSRVIGRGELVCILPRDHPLGAQPRIAPADLGGYPLITYTRSQGLAPILDGLLAAARIRPRMAVEVSLVAGAWAMVHQGAGIAVVDPYSGLGHMFPDVVVRPLRPAVPIAMEVVHAADKPLSGLAERFVTTFQAALQGLNPPRPRPPRRSPPG